MTPEEFEHYKQFFPKLEDLLRRTAEIQDEPEAREALRQVHTDFATHSKLFFETVAEADEYLEARTAALMKGLEEASKELESASAAIAQAAALPPPAPAPAPVSQPIDREVGQKLRKRLVELCDPQGASMTALRKQQAELLQTVEDWAMGSVAGSSIVGRQSTHVGAPNDPTNAGAKPSSEFDLWATGKGPSPSGNSPGAPRPEAEPPAKKYGGVDSWINSDIAPSGASSDDSSS